MQLLRLGPSGSERPAVRADGVTYDLAPVTDDVTGAFLAADGIARTRAALAAGELHPIVDDSARIGPPVAWVGKLVCIGLN